MAKKQKNTTLSQANALTESRYDFSKMEKNCIYKIIEKVRERQKKFGPRAQDIEKKK